MARRLTPSEARRARLGGGQSSSPGASTFIRWCIPGRETGGTLFKDVSGNGYDATVESGNDVAFAVDGFMGTKAGNNGGISLPLAAGAIDFTTTSAIMSLAFSNLTPAAPAVVASWGGGGGGFASPGIYGSHRSGTGVFRGVVNRGDGVLVSGDDSASSLSVPANSGNPAVYVGSATYDPISLVDGAGVTTTITVPGASLGDIVQGVSFSLDIQGITVTAAVTAANTVSVRFQNETTATIDLASGTLTARVISVGATSTGLPVRAVLLGWDAQTGSLYTYRSGALAAANVGLMTGANALVSGVPLRGPRLGAVGESATTVAGLFRGWQGYAFPGRGLPLNIGRIAAMLAESPATPLLDNQFIFSS